MNIYDRRKRLCDEYHVPYYGPTEEDLDEAATYGDMQYEMARQQELDDQQQDRQ